MKYIILYWILIIFFIVGYVKDIIHFAECDFKPAYKAEILYGVGAVTGLGAIFGYIDFGK